MRDYIRPYWKYLILTMLIIILQVYFQINIMQETKNIIDVGIQNKDLAFIDNTGIYMMILTILYGISMVASSYLTSYISAGVTCDIREGLFKKIVSLSSYDFNRFGASSLMTRATADTTRIQIFMINFINLKDMLFLSNLLTTTNTQIKY